MINVATPAAAPHTQRPYQLVAERILGLIRQAGLAPGSRLPPERELGAALAVSRTVLRSGLLALELEGVIAVRRGSGVYLSALAPAGTPARGTGAGLSDTLAARRAIEPELAAVAARVASEANIRALLDAAAEMERHATGKVGCATAHRAFRDALARCAGNSALAGVLGLLWTECDGLWHTLDGRFDTHAQRRAWLADHRHIAAAIARHDPGVARKAMCAHLERVTQILIGSRESQDHPPAPNESDNNRRGRT